MFKKIIAMIAVFLCVFSLQMAAVFADDTTTINEGGTKSDYRTVYVTNNSSTTETGTIYSITITWPDLNFTYTGNQTRTWNPTTHEYDITGTVGWQGDTSRTITIQNNSNVTVYASINFAKSPNDIGVTATLSKKDGTIPAPTESSTDTPKLETVLSLTGTPNQTVTGHELGTITVSITPSTP